MAADNAFEGSGAVETNGPARERRLRAEQRREMLLDAADTVIRRIGPRASATLIAQEAGVTKPIIYRHFGDIQDLYLALAVRHNQRLGQWLLAARERNADLDRRGRFRGVVEAFFTAIDRESNLYRFLVHAGSDLPDREGGLSWFTRLWAGEIALHLAAITGQPAGSPTPRAMGFAMAGSLQASGSWWLEERSVPLSEVVEAVTSLLLSGLPAPTVEPAALGMRGTNA
jgi:AcrR family transcriptional regulator